MNTVQSTDQIQEILWGKCYVDVFDGFGEEQSFILRSLTEREQNLSNYLYRKELKNGIKLGLFTEEQLTVSYCAYGVWTGAHEEEIEKIQYTLHKVAQQIRNAEFTPVRLKQLRKKNEKLQKELQEKEKHKLNLFSLSVENRAEEVKRRFTVSMATETLSEEPYWPNEIDFMSERDSDLILNLALLYMKKNYIPEKKLRAIARAPEWRYRWSACSWFRDR